MKRLWTVCMLGMCLLPGAAWSQASTPSEPAANDCDATGSQVALRACLEAKARDSGSLLTLALTQAYDTLRSWYEDARYISRSRTALDASQKAFERLRDMQCDFAASLSGGAAGNARDIRRLACVADMNAERVAVLKAAVGKLPKK